MTTTITARRDGTDLPVTPAELPAAVDELGRTTGRLAVVAAGRELRIVPLSRTAFSLDLVEGSGIRTATLHGRPAVLAALRSWSQGEPATGWDEALAWTPPRPAVATPARATDWQRPFTLEQWQRSLSTYPMSTMEVVDGRLHTAARGAAHDETVEAIAAAIGLLAPHADVAVRRPLVVGGDGYVPDLAVVAGDAVDVIVEVATDQTLATDLREKARAYWALEGLRRYLVVNERTGSISVHVRTADRWATRSAFLDDTTDLPSTAAALAPLLEPDHLTTTEGATPC